MKFDQFWFFKPLVLLFVLSSVCSAQEGAPRLLWSQPAQSGQYYGYTFDTTWAADGGFIMSNAAHGGAAVDFLSPLPGSSPMVINSTLPVGGSKRGKMSSSEDGRLSAVVYTVQDSTSAPIRLALRILDGLSNPIVRDIPLLPHISAISESIFSESSFGVFVREDDKIWVYGFDSALQKTVLLVSSKYGTITDRFEMNLGSYVYGAVANRGARALVLQGHTVSKIFDVAQGISSLTQSFAQPGLVQGKLDISDDGKVVVFASFEHQLTVVRRSDLGQNFAIVHSFSPGPQSNPTAISVSGNGKYLATGSFLWANAVDNRLRAWSIDGISWGGPTPPIQVLDYAMNTANSGYDFCLSDLDFDHVGKTLVAGTLGQPSNEVLTALIFKRPGEASFNAAPDHSWTTAGSVRQAQISPDGSKLLLTNTHGHTNMTGNTYSRTLSLYELDSSIVAEGVAAVGQTMTIKVPAAPGQLVSLVRSHDLLDEPVSMGYLGWLLLDNSSLVGRATANGAGEAIFTINLNGQNYGAGMTPHFMGLRNAFPGEQRRLTDSAVSFAID